MDTNFSTFFNLANILHAEIKDEIKEKTCFRESVLICKLDNEKQLFDENEDNDDEDETDMPFPVGGLCLDIQKLLDNKYVIYVSSNLDVDGRAGGSKISSWVDEEFHTIEEKRMEYISDPDGMKREIYYGVKGTKYFVNTQNHESELVDKNSVEYPLEALTNLVGEGANFLIMRLLALYHYIGKFEMSTLYINGDLCRNLYECSGTESGMVNNKKIMFCRIKRLIIEECGIIHECITVLTSNGNIIKQEWKDCDYILQMNPLKDPEVVPSCSCDSKLPKSAWKEDMELMSSYLYHNQLCKHKIKNYIQNEPQLDDILEDYMKALMHHKPSHVLEFTTDFFERYASFTKK